MNHLEAAANRRATARAISAGITDAACGGLGEWWSTREALLADAKSPREVAEAAAPAIDICHHCPEQEPCAALATTGRYTGIAAATVYVAGRPRKVRQSPAQQQSGAA